eukprot:8767531-Lingulodinium_polyedra.AAC.1
MTPPGGSPQRAAAAFARAGVAYERARLRKHDTKALRGAPEAVVLGGLLRQDGTLAAPPAKVLALSNLTLRLVLL